MTRRALLGLFFVIASATVGFAQVEEGRPFVREYKPLEIGGGGQIWDIAQDPRGVMYFATNGSILEFDGSAWRTTRVPTGGAVRSLAVDAAGRLWVGAYNVFGYLAPHPSGELRLVAVSDKVPATTRIADVWRTFVTAHGIVFQTQNGIYRVSPDGATVTVIKPATRFNRASLVKGQVYVPTPESGLNILDGDTLRPLPGTAAVGTEPFPVVLPYDDRRLLIGTRTSGLFLYDGTAMTPFVTEFAPLLPSAQIYRGLVLPGSIFVLSTTTQGVVMFDREGRAVKRLERQSGLPSSTVYSIARDREGALWLGTSDGMARVETPSPFSYYDQADGLESRAQNIARIGGVLYVAKQSGVGYLEPGTQDGSRPARFVHMPGTQTQCWDFATMIDPRDARRSAVALSCSEGLYEIVHRRLVPIKTLQDLSFRPAVQEVSAADPTRLWLGLFDGLASYRWVDGRWIDEGRVPGVQEQVRSIVENTDGSLWAGTQGDGVLRVTPASPPAPGQPRPALAIERFGGDHGLPPGGARVLRAGGVALFSAGIDEPRVLRFDDAAKRFVRVTEFDGVIGVNPFAGGFAEVDNAGRLMLNNGQETAVFERDAQGQWHADKSTFARLGRTLLASARADERGLYWVQFADGRLARFDSMLTQPPPVMSVLIRRVRGTDDHAIFDGNAAPPAQSTLAAGINSLRFEFSAPTYVDETGAEFQSRLDGFDADWSPWSREAYRAYTNLSPGTYRFRVRGRTALSPASSDATYALVILPPWYRTWWAYAGYLAIAALGLALLTRVTRQRTVARERQRAQFAEARLRAEAAETLAESEREGRKNIELISEIGREITASLDFDTIFDRLYERVNQLADAEVLGVGLYHPERQQIEYRLAIEQGKRYAPYTRDTTDPDQFPVWCIQHREAVFINDVATEYSRYIKRYAETPQRLEDGSLSREPQSLIYLPLIANDRVLGLITIQSFRTQAYTPHHLHVMRSLASYTAIALDNARAYRQLNEHEAQIQGLLEEAQRARAIAEEADAAKSSFLSTVSHELRTPLTSVLGFAKIIRKRLDDRIFPLVRSHDGKVAQTVQQVDDNLKVVISEGERLTKLIDDVLDLAKIEAGKLEWHMESVDAREIVERATTATASLFEQKGLKLETILAAELPTITGDRDRLIQVVINLISNAVKFTDAGTITCRAERRGAEIVVSVTDTGVGIAPADQPKVFERFKQVGDTLTDKPKGTGLGLPICKEIVEHHGGRIWVESAAGRGSTFSFALPLPVAQDVAGNGAAPVELAALIRQFRDQVIVTTPRTADRPQTILVVDDDPHIRELLHQELSDAGYQVRMASQGREAISTVRRDRPDLIVLDVMMPEMNGFDVAAVLKNDPQTLDIPIIILSIVQDRDRGFRLGVDRYLTKPIDTDLLFREIGTLLEQKTSHKRVMIVDEDASTVRTLIDVLTSRGYSVFEARTDELIERAVASQPDIILLNAVSSARSQAVQMLRFERGMENVLFLVYQ